MTKDTPTKDAPTKDTPTKDYVSLYLLRPCRSYAEIMLKRQAS